MKCEFCGGAHKVDHTRLSPASLCEIADLEIVAATRKAELIELRELVIRRERVHQRMREALLDLAESVPAGEPCHFGKAPIACAECPPCRLQLAYMPVRLVLMEPAEVVAQQVEAALRRPPARKLTDYKLRRCYSMHDCCVCKHTISLGQLYYDGGYGRRAHEACARRTP